MWDGNREGSRTRGGFRVCIRAGQELGVTAGWVRVRVGISIRVWVNVRVRVRVGDAPRLSCMGRAGLT